MFLCATLFTVSVFIPMTSYAEHEKEEENDETIQPTSPFLGLPTELQAHILSYLPLRNRVGAKGICKQTKALVESNLIWSEQERKSSHRLYGKKAWKLNEANGIEIGSSERFSELIPDASVVWGLKIDAFSFSSDPIPLNLLQNFPNLIALDLSGCSNIPEGSFGHIVRNCPNFIALNLSNTNVIDTDLEDLKGILLHLLNLSGCQGITSSVFNYLTSTLRNLNLNHCSQITEETLVGIAQNCPDLNELRICGCTGVQTFEALEQFSKLRTLRVSQSNIKDENICHLSLSLTSLGLAECPNLTDQGIEFLKPLKVSRLLLDHCNIKGSTFDQLPSTLQEVFLRGCSELTGEAIKHLARTCPHLTEIDLNGVNISNDNIHSLSALRKLTTLVLSDDPQGKLGITGEALTVLAKGCPDLHTLYINGYTGTFEPLEEFKKLHTLGISESSIKDEDVCHLPSSLEILKMGKCLSITDNGIQHLGKLKLTTLLLDECDITGNTFGQLHPTLEKISLIGCKQLTKNALQYLANTCPNLTVLWLNKCTQFEDEHIIPTLSTLSRLTVLVIPSDTDEDEDVPLTGNDLVHYLHPE